MPEGPEVYILTANLRRWIGADYPRIFCHGKNIFIEKRNGEFIYNHLGLTGWWTFNHSTEPEEYEKAQLTHGDKVAHFTDPRGFGKFKILSKAQVEAKLKSLGPDINGITEAALTAALQSRPRSMIGAAIMDQKTLSGIGNYLRAEILYMAKIDPRRKIASITNNEYHKLYKTLKKIFNESVNETYTIKVYEKTKDPHGNKVKTEKIGGRTLYWVPERQT